MDDLTRHHYELTYKVAFWEKKTDEFQDFFSEIMEKRHPADFMRVRPWGRLGDRYMVTAPRRSNHRVQFDPPVRNSSAEQRNRIW
jgi:hypothetical protein